MHDGIRMRLAYRGRRTFVGWTSQMQTAAEVAQATRGLLSNPGVRAPDRRTVSRIRDHARATFGSAGYAPWLEFYTTFRGGFHEGWIPDNFFQNIAIQRINGLQSGIGASRSLVTRILATPLLPDIAHFVSGEWRDPSGAHVPREKVPELLFADAEEVCVKTESSFKGRGITFVRREGLDLAGIEAAGNLVVQSVIRQHPAFGAVSPNAVATLRVTTGKLPGSAPFVIGTFLRCSLGSGRAVGDISLDVSVVDDGGTLADFASDSAWRRYTAHPETGAAFAGVQVPSYGALVASCLELHDRVPQLGLIGWDVTLDSDGAVRLMEINTGHPDIKFIEMSQGPSLRAFGIEAYARLP